MARAFADHSSPVSRRASTVIAASVMPMAKGFRYWSLPGPVLIQWGIETASQGLPRRGK